MLGRLNHVALAVPDLQAAIRTYEATLGATVSVPQPLPEHGVTVAFVDLPNTRIELLEPLGTASPIAAFLAKNPKGGMHHLCYEVADLATAAAHLARNGARVLGDGRPKIGAHGRPVIFIHPGDMVGTLIELEEV
ncbi:methylmalonyl-CoA epimerase [Aureimonas sp. SA4125]|uniref:methylmalonyl-CoA epimerase n=1 Tax=Aureimonas sp. SA4125 TaxID=2826993 RepID=UPI001CC79C7A|nr:methylmalonyl-CoA epimerase [Aureimonas sp. SA4125]